ncbi:MAG: YceI family protein [Bacteroidota bacterium]
MKFILTIICLTLSINALWAQRYLSESGSVSFFSEAPIENISANNSQVASLFDAANGQIAFAVPIKSFEFAKSLMREHFNESYLESDKYPKATFKGLITGFEIKEGKQRVSANGDLFIHGITRKVTTEGTMEISGDKILLTTAFLVKLEDYQIKVPKVVFYNIADAIQVKMNLVYKPYEKQ